MAQGELLDRSAHHLVVKRIEWQTIALAVVIYGGFLALTWWWSFLPVLGVVALGAWLVAWQSSLQHEVIHGHPTRVRWINDAIGWPPISLWLPYSVYRASHLVHHRDEHLTDPIEDPESSYLTQAAWKKLGPVGRTLALWNATLLGRLTLGPAVMILNFLVEEALAICKGDRRHALLWVRHGLGAAMVLFWVVVVCQMPLWLYLFGFVYCGAALSRIRSYAEHRFADHHEHRTAIVENSRLLGILFLFNNLHVLHHLRPGIPWYRIPALYRRDRERLIERNGGLLYSSYFEVARRYLITPHDELLHPHHKVATQEVCDPVPSDMAVAAGST